MQIFIQKLAQFVNKTVSLHQIELDEENIVKPLAIASGFIVILLHASRGDTWGIAAVIPKYLSQ